MTNLERPENTDPALTAEASVAGTGPVSRARICLAEAAISQRTGR